MRELERQGFEVTYLGVQENGLIDLEELKAAIRDDTILISVSSPEIKEGDKIIVKGLFGLQNNDKVEIKNEVK